MNIVSIADFKKGKYALSTGMYDIATLQDYIDRYETRYKIDLFGATLAAEFNADIIAGAGVPTEPRFTVIFEALSVDRLACVIHSEGIKEMLLGFIYFEYTKDQINQMTPIGQVLPVGENSDRATTLYSMIYARYNEAVKSYDTIRYYICQNMANYDGFSGNAKGYSYWI